MSSYANPSQVKYSSIRDLSDELRAMLVTKFFVEILDLEIDLDKPTTSRLNHSISRLVFEKEIPADSDFFPCAKQVYIDLEFDGGYGAKTSDGYFYVKPYSNTNPSPRSVKHIEIPVANQRTVEDFFAVIDKHHMVPCGFNTETWEAKGCKDFTSQFVYRLIQEHVLDVSPDEQYELFENFNTNYGPRDESRPGTVAYAAFNGLYHQHHIEINGIEYSGNRISRDAVDADEFVLPKN
ncbi:hypothetical protein N7493_005628 [Penicillium malachiteum]|uniref:Uncharacterized protein n=1 Tax=Penicillium malachiteum TaxID=1324776 RepID=A0AAD6HNB2_9EURO|nr:hypothetical protein N7493_005628 [Penicillium malachiteum]